MSSQEMPDKIELTRGEAIGIARILWEVMGTPGVNHATQMAAMDYALQLDLRSLTPPWPTDESSRDQVVEHLRKVQRLVDGKLDELARDIPEH